MEFELGSAEKAFENNRKSSGRRRLSREMAVVLAIITCALLLFPAVVMGSQMVSGRADRRKSGFYYGITSAQEMPGMENPENVERLVRLAQKGTPMNSLSALMQTASGGSAGLTESSGGNAVDPRESIPGNTEDEEDIENAGAAGSQGQNRNGQMMAPGGAVNKMAFKQAENMFWPDASIFYVFACVFIVAASLKIFLTEYRRNQKKHGKAGQGAKDE